MYSIHVKLRMLFLFDQIFPVDTAQKRVPGNVLEINGGPRDIDITPGAPMDLASASQPQQPKRPPFHNKYF